MDLYQSRNNSDKNRRLYFFTNLTCQRHLKLQLVHKTLRVHSRALATIMQLTLQRYTMEEDNQP